MTLLLDVDAYVIRHRFDGLPQAADLSRYTTQDLLLTFPADVTFLSEPENASILEFPEAALFGLLDGWVDAVKELMPVRRGEANTRDFYGSYDVWMVRDGEALIVEDRFRHLGFRTTWASTVRATRSWIRDVIRDVGVEFPELRSSPDYVTLATALATF